MLIIPPQKLDEATLQALLESYIGREGTDYGDQELSLEEKVAILRPQISSGQVLIVYDEESEGFSLMTREAYQAQNLA